MPLEPSRHVTPVFDAEAAADLSEVPASAVEPEAGSWREPMAPEPTTAEPAPALSPSPAPSNATDKADAVVLPESSPAVAASEAVDSDYFEELERFASATSGATRAIASEAREDQEAASAPVEEHLTPEEDPDASLPSVEPGFVRQARRQAFWRGRAVRAFLLVVALLLGTLLAAQWALQERDRLAARYPESVPLLTWLCEPMGCELGAPQRIESVVIDSSNLVRRIGNFYSFDFVVKNSDPIALAMPALELSLTDSADEVIARRVFLPEELPGAHKVVPAEDTVSISLRLSLAESGVGAMTGYRALLFYP